MSIKNLKLKVEESPANCRCNLYVEGSDFVVATCLNRIIADELAKRWNNYDPKPEQILTVADIARVFDVPVELLDEMTKGSSGGGF